MSGDPQAARPLRVACPTCKRPALFGPANPDRPFCSERCRLVDLGAWANEGYRLEAKSPPDSDESPPTAE